MSAEPVPKKAKLEDDVLKTVEKHENGLNLPAQSSTTTEEPGKDCDQADTEKASVVEEGIQESQESYLTEEDVGIKCYLCSGFQPISGVIKQRYSDFVVNELDVNGEILHLTNTDLPKQTSPTTSSSTDKLDEQKTEADADPADIVPIPEDILLRLKEMSEKPDDESTARMKAGDKIERTKVHMYVKQHFPRICSNCIEEDGVKYLEFTSHSSSQGIRDPRNRADAWPQSRPTQLHFLLYKEYKDTPDAIDIISKFSGIKSQQFLYAGMKDKRAKTTQLMSMFKVTAEKLVKVNAKLRGIKLGNFEYKENPVRLGYLGGNHFKIVLRNTDTTSDNLSCATQQLKEKGFINYFGMQRFGTTTVATYRVGMLMLKGKWLDAVDLIMAPRVHDTEGSEKARQKWVQTKDAKATLQLLPSSCNVERRLLEGISKFGLAQVFSALDRLPRSTRLLYLHSYQSYIWNTVASKRIEEYGLNPIVGDLVYDKTTPNTDSSDMKPSVKTLSESDLSEYSVNDVLIPLPGYQVTLPSNKVKDWMIDMLKEEDLTLESLKTKQHEYRLPGSYRKLLVKPTNVSSCLDYYDDIKEELVLGDLDILDGKVRESRSEGKYKATILEFSLPPSTYATMALRELTRCDTSAHHQRSLNTT